MIFSISACQNVEPNPVACDNIQNIDSLVKINGESLYLASAEYRKNDTGTLDTYEFLISAIGSNCNQTQELRFYLSESIGESLDGIYPVVESVVFTADTLTSGDYVIKQIDPFDFNRRYYKSGEMRVINHGNGNLDLDLNVSLEDGEAFTLEMRFDFE